MSEDCLTLNVYAPEVAGGDPLPVMVFIHGGGLQGGASSEYDGRHLSEAGNVIVVTINYRLGALGFLALPALDAALGVPSGNLGLRDQQLALQWIADNIAAFGGDPGNVTLFGESAGSLSACVHLFARGSETLAHRFILESGPCIRQKYPAPVARSTVEEQSDKLLADLCPGRTDALGCLRDLDAHALADWTPKTGDLVSAYVDGVFMPGEPDDLVARGEYNHGPIVVGSNYDEGVLYAHDRFNGPVVVTPAELEIAIEYLFPTHADEIAAYYAAQYGEPTNDVEASRIMYTIVADSGFRCPNRELSRALTAQGSTVYLYSFDVPPGAHVLELDYVFGHPIATPLFSDAPSPLLEGVIQATQGYWTSFARTGDPNGSDRVPWPRYATASDEHLGIGEPLSAGSGLAKRICDLMTAE